MNMQSNITPICPTNGSRGVFMCVFVPAYVVYIYVNVNVNVKEYENTRNMKYEFEHTST